MSKKYAPALELRPRFSRWLAGWAGFIHAIAGLASVANGLILPWRVLLLVVVVMGHLVFQLHRLAGRNRSAPILIRHTVEEGWSVQEGAGQRCSARLLSSTVVTPWVVFLHLRLAGGDRRDFVLPRDSLDPETFRRLRVLLTTHGSTSA